MLFLEHREALIQRLSSGKKQCFERVGGVKSQRVTRKNSSRLDLVRLDADFLPLEEYIKEFGDPTDLTSKSEPG